MSNIIAIPTKTAKQLEKFLTEKEAEKVEWIDEEEARKLLSRKKVMHIRSFRNLIYKGKIPPSCYKKAVNGKKIFNKRKLLGLE